MKKILDLIYKHKPIDPTIPMLDWPEFPHTKRYEIRWWLEHGIKNKIRDLKYIPYNIKCFWYRGRRGWSTRDVWGLDSYLAEVISNSVKNLRDNLISYPIIEGYYDYETMSDKPGIDASKAWEDILDEIIWTFDTARKIADTWTYLGTKNWNEKNYNTSKEISDRFSEIDSHTMTYDECVRYEKGWKLFQEYFHGLWN